MDQIIIAASTHWDREWYRTFQDFQIRLCDMMNRLLDLLEQEPGFLCYTFDGQSVVLDDYLEIHPENRERIRSLTESGRLVFGPLYNLPDEFLSGGEALIRNFLLGDQVCGPFGGAMKAGYVPDNFGHIAQLPQILNGVGIDTALFFRGTHMDTIKHKEFYWDAPDGSRVLCEYMPLGYWSLKSWGKLGKNAVEHVQSAYETLKKDSGLGTFLLINGSDHLYQDPDFVNNIALAQQGFPGLDIKNGSIKDYADLMKQAAKELENTVQLHTVTGELRDFRYGPDPTAVTSTRARLKRLLFETLAETERYTEPLAEITRTVSRQYSYPEGFFTKIWKQICISLGHDGISGCSTDEVMNDIESYLVHGKQTAEKLSELAFHELADSLNLPEPEEGQEYLYLFNPHPFPYTGVIRQTLYLERGEQRLKDFTILDQDGKQVPYELISVGEDVITREFLYNSKEKIYRDKAEVFVKVKNLAPMGITVYRIVRLKWMEKRQSEHEIRLTPSNPWIENSRYKISVNWDGSLMVLDKKTGQNHSGVNALVSRGDIGDEYQHVSPLMDQHVFARRTGLRVVVNSSLTQTLKVCGEMEIPQGMSEDMLGRSPESKICRFETQVTLCENDDLIRIKTTVDNPCADHILYAKFPAGFDNGREFSYVSFDETERQDIRYPFDETLKSTQSVLRPMQKYAGVVGTEDGIQVAAKGIYEYHTKGDGEEKELYLTLIRSTSYLFHGLPVSWLDGQQSTTPIVKTPGARELGPSTLEYAVTFGTESIGEAAEMYLYPPRAACFPAAGRKLRENSLKPEFSQIRWENPSILLSAMKKHREKEGTVIRLFNRDFKPQILSLETGGEIKECWSCDLLEHLQEKLSVHDTHHISLEIAAKKIITLYISWR